MAKRNIFRFTFFVFLLVSLSAIGSAAIVYVATDGSGDYNCDGSEDQVQINKALAYVDSIGGGTVYLKSGTYVIGDSVLIGDNTVLTGDSSAKIKIENNAYWSDWSAIIEPISGTSGNIKIHGFELDGNYANNDEWVKGKGHYYMLIYFEGVDNIEVYDMYLHDNTYDLMHFGTGSHISVHDNVGRKQGHEFVWFYKCDDAEVYNNDMSIAINTGVRCEMTDNIVIHDNKIYAEVYSGYTGIYVQSFNKYYPVTSVEIYNNEIYDTKSAGIYLLGFDDGSDRVLTDKSQASGVYIHNNVIYGTGRAGTAPGGGISSAGFDDVVIENNVIHDVTGNGISIYYNRDDLSLSGFTYYVRNNVITSCSGYGIRNYESSTHTVIAEYNDIYGNSAGTYTGSSISYSNNLNVDPEFASTGDDFHLKSVYGRWSDGKWVTDDETSPLVDAGDPDSEYDNEPVSGNRVNIGAYGNTIQASKSYSSGEEVIEDPVEDPIEDPVEEPVEDDTPTEAGDTDGISTGDNTGTGLNISYGTATIDGSLSDWADTTGITLYGDSDRAASKDNTATVKAMYDDEYLYLAYDVDDTNLQATRELGDSGVHLDDGIEMYIDTRNNGGTAMQTDDYHIIINLNGAVIDDVGTGTGKNYDYVIDMDENVNLKGTLNDADDTDTGYVIEVAVLWDDIGGFPSDDIVGMLVAVNDKDSESDVYLLNYCDLAKGTYAIPNNWGEAIIKEQPPVNTAPEFNTVADITVTEKDSISFAVSAADAEGDSLSYSAVSLPEGASFNAATATFTWTTGQGDAGSYEAVFKVTDGSLSDQLSVSITVEELPVTSTGELSVVYGTATIDGSLSDWADTTGITLYGDSDRASSKDNTATIKAMYDDEYLYLAYDVDDTNLQATRVLGDSGVHLDDGIEMYVDTRNNGGTAMQTDDYHIIINLNGAVIDDAGTGTGKNYDYVINMIKKVKLDGTVNDATDTDSGYIIEVAVPWEDIGGTPSDVVGMLVAVNDRDSESDVYLLNYGDLAKGTYAVPDNWKDVTVEEPPVINTAPEFNTVADITVTEKDSVSFTVSAADAEGDSLSYSAVSLPEGASFNAATATFTWTTGQGDAGSYEAVFKVTDGSLSDQLSVSIIVEELPVTSVGELSVVYGTATIDGSLSDWTGVSGITLYGDSDRASSKDNTATIKAMYDDEYLYLAYDVDDTNLQATRVLGNSGVHLDDGIEMYIDTRNNGGTAMQTDDYHLIINLNGAVIDDVGTGTGKNYDYVINMIKKVKLDGTVNDATDTDSGYIIEVAVPWKDIGGTPSDVVGMLVAVNDRDSESDVYLLNYGDLAKGTYAVPDNWEDVTIEEPANHAPVILLFEPADGSVFEEGSTVTVNAFATDEDEQTLSYAIFIDGTQVSSGSSYSWDTDYESAGTHTFEVVVSDGEDESRASSIVTITDLHPRWDVNEDGVVSVLDIDVISQNYGTTYTGDLPRWDVNQDGSIDIKDISIVLEHFGETVN